MSVRYPILDSLQRGDLPSMVTFLGAGARYLISKQELCLGCRAGTQVNQWRLGHRLRS